MGRICQDGHARDPRYGLFQKLHTFTYQLTSEECHAHHVSPRSRKTLDKPGLNRITTEPENNGISVVVLLAGIAAPPIAQDDVNFIASQLASNRRNPLALPFRMPGLNGDGLSLNVAKLMQRFTKCLEAGC
jgi:hypothetical protein